MFHALRFLIHAEGAQRLWWGGGNDVPTHGERGGGSKDCRVFHAGQEGEIVGLAFFAAAAAAVAAISPGERKKASETCLIIQKSICIIHHQNTPSTIFPIPLFSLLKKEKYHRPLTASPSPSYNQP